MKRIVTSLLIVCSMLLFFTGCTNQKTKKADPKPSSMVTNETATITLQEDGVDTLVKKVTFHTGENLLDVLEQNFSVEEDKGFIISINGQSQNTEEKKYWMFSVDGKNTKVGAKETILKNNQTVIFNLDTL